MTHWSLLFAFFFLFSLFILTAVSSGFRRIRRHQTKQQAHAVGNFFFYSWLQKIFFRKNEFETLFFATICAKNIFRFGYACSVMWVLHDFDLFKNSPDAIWPPLSADAFPWIYSTGALLGALLLSLFFADFIPRVWANRHPRSLLRLLAPPASFLLTLCFPLSFLFLRLSPLTFNSTYPEGNSATHIKEKIIEIIQENHAQPQLEAADRRLIEAVIPFKDRIVREIMIPRIDIFSVEESLSIREAAQLMAEEGYSRVPVYQESLDQITGLLMYKDILSLYMKEEMESLDLPVSSLAKEVLYTPETKKVSRLLQEFRDKQMHFAIVVDEYGGTEGIVTIEDILEELVGEIADEYDEESECLYEVLPESGWIVDARMHILDIEEKLGISIPQDGEYDTIGGYVFHRAGEIPARGLVIHHDQFELEILSSTERCVEKIRIIPLTEEGQKPLPHAEES